MRTELRHCGSCGDLRRFETPPCADGHGADCPERACTVCGAATLVDPPAETGGAPAARTSAVPGTSAAPAWASHVA